MSRGRHILAYYIKMTRMMRGLTQQEVADRLHKTTNAVSNWENGNTSPPVEVLVELCEVLDVTPSQICGWEEIEGFEEYCKKSVITEKRLSELEIQKREIEREIQMLKQGNRKQ